MKKYIKVIGVSIVVAIMYGCASPGEISQFASSRVLPCPSTDIVVSNVQSPGLSSLFYWDATCKGKTYRCTGRTTGNQDMQDVSCKE